MFVHILCGFALQAVQNGNTDTLTTSALIGDFTEISDQPVAINEFSYAPVVNKEINSAAYSSEKWQSTAPQIPTSGVGVRLVSRYNPSEGEAKIDNNAKPIVLFVVHGTGFYGSGGPATLAYYDLTHQDYKNILKFAYQYAQMRGAPIEVVSFRWGGENMTKSREEVGKALASLMNTKYKDHEIVTLSHSHGGNVVNIASNHLKNVTINYMLQLATPVREKDPKETFYRPTNFNHLLMFYSTGDVIQVAGAISFSSLENFYRANKSTRKYVPREFAVKNVRVLNNGAELGHSAFVSGLLANIFDVLVIIETKYPYEVDLEVNLTHMTPYPMVVIRHPLEKTPYAKFYKMLLDALTPELREAIQNQRKEAQTYSDFQAKMFKALYGKSIFEKSYSVKGLSSYIASLYSRLIKS